MMPLPLHHSRQNCLATGRPETSSDLWVICKLSYPQNSITVSSIYNLFLQVIIQITFQVFSQKCLCKSSTLVHWCF